ncbi:MAG: ABC transporter ATP-binding protein [Corallococcus sp.]|nr:ABC transporter ATP-binding protein [Corallococcus sp.]
MSQPIIQTYNLTKVYPPYKAVNSVSLTVNKGEICGLVGRNGAGKTTLIRLLTNLIKPTEGSFAICPDGGRTDTTVAAIVERPSIYPDMTGVDNLEAQCRLLGIVPDKEKIYKTLELVGLTSTLKKKAKNYSLGMRQRLAIAMTIIGEPELLILDEPTNGLDPQGIHDMRELFVKLNKDYGMTILISSHILSELGKFATTYCFMEKGKIIEQISAEELANRCKKHIKVTVNSVLNALAALKRAGIGEVRADGDAIEILREDVVASNVISVLAAEGIEVSDVTTVGGDLEDYFINLTKGGGNL